MPYVQKYPAGWRVLHWVMALMVLTLIPVGLWMASRAEADIWGAVTNTLYSVHKAVGFTVLLLILVRIVVKLRMKTPPYPESMPRTLQMAAKSVHHLIYLLLVLTPLFGWAGVTAFPALTIVGDFSLPAMPFVDQDEALASRLFYIHGWLAIALGALVAGHIAAALRHLLRKDGIFQRMV